MFVITTLVLMGAMLAVLGSMSQKFVFETNQAYLDMCSRNLSASGLAWAKHTMKNKSLTFSDGRISLDVNDMKMPHATLSLDVSTAKDGTKEITTHTSIIRNGQRCRKDTAYLISQ
jgi:hypothetical protein